jgi:type IV pilus assembly protein PilM
VLERCAIEPLERGWITDGNVEKFDEVAEAMRRVVKKSGTRTRNVAMALPPSAVITKKIMLPGGLSEQELEVQVETEANQYIPVFAGRGESRLLCGRAERLVRGRC